MKGVGSAVFCPLLVHPLLEWEVDHGGLGREAEKVIPFCSTMCELKVCGPRVEHDGGSVMLLLENNKLAGVTAVLGALPQCVILTDLYLYC